MARPKSIRIPEASFQSGSWSVKTAVLTTLKISAPFNQLVADNLGVKEQIFVDGSLPEDFKRHDLRTELYAAKLTVLPTQGRLEDKKLRDGCDLLSLKIHGFTVVRDQGSDALRLTFSLTGLDGAGEIHKIVHAMRRDVFDATITPGSQQAAAAATDQIKMFDKDPADKKAKKDEEGDGVEE